MMPPPQFESLEERAHYFKALGHPLRLVMLSLIEKQPRHGEALALMMKRSPATISHHLSMLTEAGLLRVKKDQYYHIYSLVPEMVDIQVSDLLQLHPPEIEAVSEEDAFRQRVLRGAFRNGRLVSFPVQLKKKEVILQHLVELFAWDREYSEQEVNGILLEVDEDVATLRRYMVDLKLMARERGVYWRI